MDREAVQKIIELESKTNPFRNLLGIVITDIDEGVCRGELEVQEKHMNPLGTVHGGCLYTMSDTLGGIAAATMGMPGPTISGDMYFMRSLMGAKKLTCEARVIKNGTKIRVVESSIWDEKGNEAAKCMLQYMDLGVPLTD